MNPAKLRSSDDSTPGTTPPPLNDRGHQGWDGQHPFARLGGDLEFGKVKVGREAGRWTVVERASVGADLDG